MQRIDEIRHSCRLFVILAIVFVAIDFLLTPNTPYPVVPDDFLILGGGVSDMAWWWKRPVAANAIFLIGEAGRGFAFFSISALAVATAGMALIFIGRLFDVRWHWVSIVAFSAIVFSQVSAFEHSKYLGLLTNLISHLFGMATLLFLWDAWKNRGGWRWFAMGLTYLLSVFAKEDFILPPLLLAGFLWFARVAHTIPQAHGSPARRGRLAATAALVVIGSGSLIWNLFDRNPFISGLLRAQPKDASYAVHLEIPSLMHAAWILFAEYVPLVSILALLAWAALWWTTPAYRARLIFLAGLVTLLALPYMLIPNNMPQYRAYAWLPWLGATVTLAMQVFANRITTQHPGRYVRIAVLLAYMGIGLGAAWTHHDARLQRALQYRSSESLNRRMISSLQDVRQNIRGESIVGLRGLSGLSPWCGNDARYINNKLGFRNRWLIFVPAESSCYKQLPPDIKKKRGINVFVAKSDRVCDFQNLKILDFAADGSARLRTSHDVCIEQARRQQTGRDLDNLNDS